MLFKLLLVFCIALEAVRAEDLSQGAEGTNLELSKGYQFSTLIDSSGKPAGQAYAYLGGKLTQVPPTPYYGGDGSGCTSSTCGNYPASSTSSALSLTSLTALSYFAAGVIAALSFWYCISVLIAPSFAKKNDQSEDADKATDATGEKGKSRRRRATRRADEEMTQLAEIVLASVESGECLQKSICLMGSQLSARKGKLADSLLSTLLPQSIQQTDIFLILKRSLRGEISCEKFGCRH